MTAIDNICIPIFFTFNKHYVLPAVVAFNSLLEYASKDYYYKLYVLHSDLSVRDQQRLMRTINPFRDRASLSFINVEPYHTNSDWSNLNSKQHYSKEIFNKLIAEIVFPQYDRIICSDVDVIFRGDISQSYFMPTRKSYIAGIKSIGGNSIINWYHKDFIADEIAILSEGIGAGYFVMNLDRIREDRIGDKMRAYYSTNLNRLIQPEQDVLNLCCYPYIEYLPLSYMVCTSLYKLDKKQIISVEEVTMLDEALKNPIQIHYAGYNKPWNSFFITKWTPWIKSLLDAGGGLKYLKLLPFYLFQRRKKYNLKRFIRKVKNKIISQNG